MNDFQFQNTTKVYFGKDQLGHLHEEVLNMERASLLFMVADQSKKLDFMTKS